MSQICQSARLGLPVAANKPTRRPLWAPSRRDLLLQSSFFGLRFQADGEALAVQGYTAGRIPGVSETPNSQGFYSYNRPVGKSGGHGVGWTEIPPYSFLLPAGWEEIPVSIADLGGTEIDLRFGNSAEGSLEVVVAPVLRFLDVEFNTDVRIDDIGTPQQVIEGFAPELFGSPLEEDDVLSTDVTMKDGIPYYTWEIKPHRLVTATASGNRAFLLSITANSRQWRKAGSNLKTMVKSFHL